MKTRSAEATFRFDTIRTAECKESQRSTAAHLIFLEGESILHTPTGAKKEQQNTGAALLGVSRYI